MTHVLFVHGGDEEAPLVEKRLRRSDRFDVRRAHEAEEVLETGEDLLSENGRAGPDLLISSWFLPRLNGPAFAEALREAGADVPILLLASRQDAEVRAKALRHGADACLTRPVDSEVFFARLRALLRRPSTWQRVDRIQAGPLQMDAARREARVYGSSLGLRKKEFDFLYLLADRRPAVVGREMVATRVWGGGHVSDNSIDVTISGLRSKLEEARSPGSALSKDGSAEERRAPRVETIRGVGYRLALEPEGSNRAPTPKDTA